MLFVRSVFMLLLIVVTTSCVSREKLDDTNRTSTFLQEQTKLHFDFIEHSTIPAAGSLYNKDDKFVGSCVLVTKNIALTAAHCIHYGDLKYVRFGEEKILIDMQFIHKDYFLSGDDIGLLAFATESTHTPMPVLSNVGHLGAMIPLRTIAHGGGDKKISKDDVFRFYGILKNRPNEVIFLPLKTTVWFGDSGGALVWEDSDGNYALVGIITHFSTADDKIYECAARRTDTFNLCDDIWHPWFVE
mgnify:CR=1 FL=1